MPSEKHQPKVLLTGATGFIGRHIEKALSQEYDVITIGRSQENQVVWDLQDEKSPELPKVDFCVHCAGKAHIVPKNKEEEEEFFRVNYLGTKRLFEGMEPNQGVVLISTVAVYGKEKGESLTEEAPTDAVTPYGKSKLLAEKYVEEWSAKLGVPCLILRLPLVVGHNTPGNFGAMYTAIKSGKYVNVGGGQAMRSLVLASDVAEVVRKQMGSSGVYNLKAEKDYSFKTISDLISQQLGQKPPRNLPYFVGWCAAIAGEAFQRILRKNFPIDLNRLEKMTSSLTFSGKKAQAELGFMGKPLEAELDAWGE